MQVLREIQFSNIVIKKESKGRIKKDYKNNKEIIFK